MILQESQLYNVHINSKCPLTVVRLMFIDENDTFYFVQPAWNLWSSWCKLIIIKLLK